MPNKNKLIHMGFSNNIQLVVKFFKDNIVDIDNNILFKKIFKDYKPEIIVDYNKNSFGELLIILNFLQKIFIVFNFLNIIHLTILQDIIIQKYFMEKLMVNLKETLNF